MPLRTKALLSVPLALGLAAAATAQTYDRILQVREATHLAAAESQARIDQLSDETRTLLARYQAASRQADSLKVYVDQLEKLVASQETEKRDLQAQIDGVSDVDISAVIRFHEEQKVLATLTAAQPPGRFGALTLGSEQTYVHEFREKPGGDGAWVNGGFFVLEPGAIDYVTDDSTIWEREPLERLARDGNLAAYKHRGFWHPMDSLRDKVFLEELWNSGNPPWKVW